MPPASATDPTSPATDAIHPQRTLWMLSLAHAVNHAQAVLLPLIFLKIIDEFGVSVQEVTFVAAAGAIASGLIQASYGFVTRHVARRLLLTAGGLLFGLGFAAQAATTSFLTFAVTNVISRVGGSPQHPVGNALLAEQFPAERRGFAISAHISGGNVGTVIAALAGPPLLALAGWRGASIVFGIPAALIALAMYRWIRETGADRLAAISQGSVREAARTVWSDHRIRRTYLASVFGGGGRGLGVANLFALLYVTHVLALPEATTNLMYAGLIVLSVPMPLVAGWLSDRVGRRPIILGAYLGGAVGFLTFIAAGSSLVGLWVGIAIMGLFSFAESPQLQALLADIAPTGVRDVAFALYFTLAFGVGSLWTAVYGTIIEAAGASTGLPIVFGLMATSFLVAALIMFPVKDPPRVARVAGAALAND
ncbi:MAG TPA: MFS transporter [Candidatus Limnocylindria bacterium]|nr:MFS transporter [Candidatus Limnocylindria bacterium]